jgi:RHS repeat-associated protein
VATAGEGGAATRFQLGNHLGSAVLEVDEAGKVLSYEEYHPYGTTAYRSATGAAEVSLKRYTGKERDEETGLYYPGARYYAPWLGRWTASDPKAVDPQGVDPKETADGPNQYDYVMGNPIRLLDPDGRQPTDTRYPEPIPAPWHAPTFRDARTLLGKMGLPVEFMDLNLSFGIVSGGGKARHVSEPPVVKSQLSTLYGTSQLSLSSGHWENLARASEINPSTLEARTGTVTTFGHEASHAFIQQHTGAESLFAQKLGWYVEANYLYGILKKFSEGVTIAHQIARETLGMQAGQWVGTYYAAAQKLASATTLQDVRAIMSEYDQGMAKKMTAYYYIYTVPSPADVRAGRAHGEGAQWITRDANFTLTPEQFKEYREMLLPGITGKAADDFKRILSSEWGHQLPANVQKMVRDEINRMTAAQQRQVP